MKTRLAYALTTKMGLLPSLVDQRTLTVELRNRRKKICNRLLIQRNSLGKVMNTVGSLNQFSSRWGTKRNMFDVYCCGQVWRCQVANCGRCYGTESIGNGYVTPEEVKLHHLKGNGKLLLISQHPFPRTPLLVWLYFRTSEGPDSQQLSTRRPLRSWSMTLLKLINL